MALKMLQSYRPRAALCLQPCLEETAATRSDVKSRNAPSATDLGAPTAPEEERSGNIPRESTAVVCGSHTGTAETPQTQLLAAGSLPKRHLAPYSSAGRGGVCCSFHPHTQEESQMALGNSCSGDEYKKYPNHQNSRRFLTCVTHRHPALTPPVQ